MQYYITLCASSMPGKGIEAMGVDTNAAWRETLKLETRNLKPHQGVGQIQPELAESGTSSGFRAGVAPTPEVA